MRDNGYLLANDRKIPWISACQRTSLNPRQLNRFHLRQIAGLPQAVLAGSMAEMSSGVHDPMGVVVGLGN
jgi:hypothetical protein